MRVIIFWMRVFRGSGGSSCPVVRLWPGPHWMGWSFGSWLVMIVYSMVPVGSSMRMVCIIILSLFVLVNKLSYLGSGINT